jgi:hypothetical protein
VEKIKISQELFSRPNENGNDGCSLGILKMFVGCCILKTEILKCSGLGSFHVEKRDNLFISNWFTAMKVFKVSLAI